MEKGFMCCSTAILVVLQFFPGRWILTNGWKINPSQTNGFVSPRMPRSTGVLLPAQHGIIVSINCPARPVGWRWEASAWESGEEAVIKYSTGRSCEDKEVEELCCFAFSISPKMPHSTAGRRRRHRSLVRRQSRSPPLTSHRSTPPTLAKLVVL